MRVITSAERREIVTAFAKLKGLLLPWCCMCQRATRPPIPNNGTTAGLSDGICPRCMPAYMEQYGFKPKRQVA